MVQLHIKKNDESQFLFQSSVNVQVDDCYESIVTIYNGRLKINRICKEIDRLRQGIKPLGTGDEMEMADKGNIECTSSVGICPTNDLSVTHVHNSEAVDEKGQKIFVRAIEEAEAVISKKQVQAGVFLTEKKIQETLDMLHGAVTTVYPVNVPSLIKRELENYETLPQMQDTNEVIEDDMAQLWFSNKLLERGRKLSDYIGRNEKTKVVLKITKSGGGPPLKEPPLSDEEKKQMMLHAYRRQGELMKLEQNDDDMYLNATWADSGALKKSLQGFSDVTWKTQ